MSKSKKGIVVILLLLIALLVVATALLYVVWNRNQYTVAVSMSGEREMTLEVGSSFVDPGAEASASGSLFDKEKKPLEVKSSGYVDTQTVGTYELRYAASYSRKHFLGDKQASGEGVRLVHIVDTQAPVISLNHKEDYYTLPGQIYEEEGFSAEDGYDGDLTGQVIREERDGKVYYTVSDSSGNQAQAVRDIYYNDPIAPELTLTGDAVVQVLAGQAFDEPGFAASDNVDGDITGRVTVSGAVDTQKPGRYTLTYTVADSYGNTASQTRVIKVVETKMAELPKGKGGVIYLTFDDGPGPYTQKLLDILDKYNVKATFFVVGRNDLSILSQMVEKGHSVGNHTYSHSYKKIYASEDAFFNELYRAQDCIEAACGKRTRLVRFPGGTSNSVSKVSMRQLAKSLTNAGYAYFDWNVDSNDAGGAKTSDEVVYNVCSGVANKSVAVVLQHDIKEFSVDAVEEIIIWGLENGYTFEALDVSSPGTHHRPSH